MFGTISSSKISLILELVLSYNIVYIYTVYKPGSVAYTKYILTLIQTNTQTNIQTNKKQWIRLLSTNSNV